MSVKDKLIDLYMEVAWDIVLRPELTNKQKIRILNNIIHDEITRLSMGVDNNGGCAEYCEFLKKLKRIHKKVDSSDLSDFTELKI
jgi:hypothetical protein